MKFFISSTYEDLKEIRRVAINILKGYVVTENAATGTVIAMEFFTASENSSREVCLQELSSCDMVIGIYGNRFGYVDERYDATRSMTEIEFDYAVEHGIPILSFILRSDTREQEEQRFIREKVTQQGTNCAFFDAKEDFADELDRAIKDYFGNMDGYSAESLWSDIREMKKQTMDYLELEPFIPGEEDTALETVLFSVRCLQDFVEPLRAENDAINFYAQNTEMSPSQNTTKELYALGDNVSSVAKEIIQNWEHINQGIPNHVTHIKMAAHFLKLSRIQHRLLTEPWCENLRQDAVNTRDGYKEVAASSRYID